MKKRVVNVTKEPMRECPWCHKLSPFPGEWSNGTKEKGRVIYVCGDCAKKETSDGIDEA